MNSTQFAAQWLSQLQIEPVLVDVGAAGAVPDFWRPLAPHAFYIGFDPDSREMGHQPERGWKRAQIFPFAVVADSNENDVEVFLTSAPQCSSTLPPDQAALDHYDFAASFHVEAREKCAASTLAAALQTVDVAGPDWLKLDTQGTDWRIFASLNSAQRAQVLAVDVEPGLVDAYQGEDLFAPTHAALVKEGFWPVHMKVCGVSRGHVESWKSIGWTGERAARVVAVSPVWVEARYFRSVESLRPHATERQWVLLGLFAAIEKQWGFVLDVSRELEPANPQAAKALREWATAELVAAEKRSRNFLGRVARSIKRRLF